MVIVPMSVDAMGIGRRVSISEGEYLNRPHFVINTKNATYFLDKAGGGLSRLIDREGKDWICYSDSPRNEYPASAASSYRGLPNFVHKSEDDGAGYPGRNQCYSFQVNDHTILTISKSGQWQWRWQFFKDHARLTVEKIDEQHKYWFMYEGVVAGRFAPFEQYWGNNLGGPRYETHDYYRDDKIFANWLWAYFGDQTVKRVFFVAMDRPDRYIDTFSYLGSTDQGIHSPNGMVVFGFGRMGDSEPQLTDTGNTFLFGFVKGRVKNQGGHESVQKEIENLRK
jgi:hypothetical protein